MKKKKNCIYLRDSKVHAFIQSLDDEKSPTSGVLKDSAKRVQTVIKANDALFFSCVKGHVVFNDLPEEITARFPKPPKAFEVRLSTVAMFDSLSPKDYTGRHLAKQIVNGDDFVFIDSEDAEIPAHEIAKMLKFDKMPTLHA